jgi:hypothetical protein
MMRENVIIGATATAGQDSGHKLFLGRRGPAVSCLPLVPSLRASDLTTTVTDETNRGAYTLDETGAVAYQRSHFLQYVLCT